MGNEKQLGSKGGGGYVGGFLHLFDWNTKSRKKLFSGKSDSPEQQMKHKKRSHDSMPMAKFHQMDEDENAAGSSVRESSDYSCASSVTDEEHCGRKAPGVVARLMGLDTLPTSNFSDSFSAQSFDSQSLQDSTFYRKKDLDFQRDPQITHSGYLSKKVDPKPNPPTKIVKRPIEKFQTEVLPPKSAKSISATHHKLLSPIKGPSFVPSKDVAHIMEAAAKIIDPGTATNKAKMPHIGSSSVPLKMRELKEKLEAAKRTRFKVVPEVSRRPVESNATKYLKGQSMNRSWNGSVDSKSSKVSSDLEECSSASKNNNKGKSISLALQAKVNVQKREGLNYSTASRNVFAQPERCESLSQDFKSQPNTQRSSVKKLSTHNSSNVLRPNNQKQNSLVDRGKLPSKSLSSSSTVRKVSNGDTSSGRKISGKLSVKPKTSYRKSSIEVTESKKEILGSSSKNVNPKKRSLDGDFQFEKNQIFNTVQKAGKSAAESNDFMDRRFDWAEDNKRNGMDVISFTFTAPMTRSTASNERNNSVCSDYRGINPSKLSSLGYNVIGGDSLSTQLEQKLKELSYGVEFSNQKPLTAVGSASIFNKNMAAQNRNLYTDKTATQTGLRFSLKSSQGLVAKHKPQGSEELDECSTNSNEIRKLLECRHPSPISVLDPSYLTESCNSSDTADSNTSENSKMCSSVQAQEVVGIYPSKKFHITEADAELSDSASSTSTMHIKQAESTKWELEYVKEILCDVESMFKDFSSRKSGSSAVINPHLFDLLEAHHPQRSVLNVGFPKKCKQNRKVVFECVSQCMQLRCTRYLGGGYSGWKKGLSVVRRKERLAEEVYKEIKEWKMMGDCMVDEIVDKDMSSYYGKWLDYDVEVFEVGVEIEGRILNHLINEVVADLLRC